MKKRLPSPEHADTLSLDALRRLVSGLVEKAEHAETRLAKLETENAALREEIARLKNLPPRPPFRPSGMDKATDQKPVDGGGKKKPRGAKRDMDRISREQILTATVPSGSRFKGYKSCYVRGLILQAELVHYRRECCVTPAGEKLEQAGEGLQDAGRWTKERVSEAADRAVEKAEEVRDWASQTADDIGEWTADRATEAGNGADRQARDALRKCAGDEWEGAF